MRSAIEWVRKAWEQLSVKTVRNCWNHAKVLPAPVSVAGPDDNVMNNLRALLLEFSGASLSVEDIIDDPTERWIAHLCSQMTKMLI